MARMLCLCAPAGQDEFFAAVGFPVEGRTSPPPKASEAEVAEKRNLMAALLPKYRTENRAVTRPAHELKSAAPS